DVRKDSLYCDRPDSIKRRAVRTVMDEVFSRLTAWLAPLTPFTMDEAWTTRFPEAGTNCARVIPETPGQWRNTTEAERWNQIKKLLEVATGAIELERREKRIGGALDAWPVVYLPEGNLIDHIFNALEGIDLAEVLRTSGADVRRESGPADAFRLPNYPFDISVVAAKADYPKCARSWRRVPDVGSDADYPDLSARDADAVRWLDAQKA